MPDQTEADKHEDGKTVADKSAIDAPDTGTFKRSYTIELLHQIGLRRATRCYRDYRFLLALVAAVFVLWAIHDMLPQFSSNFEFHWKLWLSLIIWNPVFEEILFRGILQGQLKMTRWGQRSWLTITAANVVTSMLFVAIHMIKNPPLFSLSVFIPSLVFGYFRDYCNSVYPSILLHSAYNAMVLVGLIIAGNMSLPSL